MANKIYETFAAGIMACDTDYQLTSAEGATGVFAALVDTGTYTYSTAHQFYSDLSGVVGTDIECTTKTVTLGAFDSDLITFVAVTGATVEALVFYRKNAGANTTWPLIAFVDAESITGLPVTPNSGDIEITPAAGGWFKLDNN